MSSANDQHASAASGGKAVRPGGRTARNAAAVLDAVLAELGEHGYADLTVERVATRSGVHKATIYRRWGGVDGLLSTALARVGADAWRPPQTGALHTDLHALIRGVVESFASKQDGPVAIAAIAAAFESERVASALRDFFADRHGRSAAVVDAAVERGEVPAGTDGREVVKAAVSPIYYRLFVSREPVADVDIERAARATAEAAIAGTFRGAA